MGFNIIISQVVCSRRISVTFQMRFFFVTFKSGSLLESVISIVACWVFFCGYTKPQTNRIKPAVMFYFER